MPNAFRSVQGAGRRAAALPTGYRINLALYSLVLLGIGLIAVEVRGDSPPLRQVQTLPRLTTDTTRYTPVIDSAPPTVLGPGDLTPTPPPAVTPGGVVVGSSAPSPSAPAGTASDSPTPVAAEPDPVPTPAPDPVPQLPVPVFSPALPGNVGLMPPLPDRGALLPVENEQPPTTGADGRIPRVTVTTVSIPPVKLPPRV